MSRPPRPTYRVGMTAITAPRTLSFSRVAGGLVIVAAATGIAGAIALLVVPPAVPPDIFSYPLEGSAYAVVQASFFVNHVLLGLGLVALLMLPVSRARPGHAGLWIALVGMAVLAVCELWAIGVADAAYPSPETAPLDIGYGVSSIALGVGLVLAGIGVARSREWSGWRRWIVLVAGVMLFVVVLPGLLAGFVGGRIGLALWMVAWGLIGVALVTERPPGRPA